MTKAIENTEAILEAGRNILNELGDKAEPEWKEFLENMVDVLETMKTQFFMKTNMAIPGTKACLRDITEIQSLISEGDPSKLPDAFTRLRANLEKLLSQAKMEGVALT